MLRLILPDKQPSYVDFLTVTYGNQFSPEYVALLTGTVRSSASNQYQSCWKSWVSFVHSEQPSEITPNFMISYFRFLSEVKGFKPATVRTYKAALREPILQGFGIDLRDELFHKVSKTLALRNPSSPPRPLMWSLEKVLDLLSGLDVNGCSPKELLDKTIFLVALTSGGRVSEISALYRGSEYINVSQAGVLTLCPGPGFLTKNEDPIARRKPWKIPSLPSAGDASLCPVATLQAYLERTACHCPTGPLFRHQESFKPLSVHETRRRITSLIKRANPQSNPRAHDTRKMASSLAFFADMTFEDISQMTNWSSTGVFLRHYLQQVSRVRQCCVVLGSVVPHGASTAPVSTSSPQ